MKSFREQNTFFTPEWYAEEQSKLMEPARGKLLIAGCRSGNLLTQQVIRNYNNMLKQAGSRETVLYLQDLDEEFSDSEICVRLEKHVGGYDVFLLQALYDPTTERKVDQNYMAFLIAARTLREHGAKNITGILPYLAYSRQDKPTKFKREPTTAKLMADLSVTAGVDRIISWNPHSDQLHGFYGKTPVNMLNPLTLFEKEFSRFIGRGDVIAVSPDVGASKMITHFGRKLDVNSAIASKYRPKPEEVITTEIIGDFAGKKIAVLLDDIIGSAGTIYSVVKQLVQKYNIEEIFIGISHFIGTGDARNKLIELHNDFNLKELVITDSIPQNENIRSLSFVKVRSLSEILSLTINRIHYNRSVSEIFYQ